MPDQVINAAILYPLVITLLVGAAEFGIWCGRRFRGVAERAEG
jgi:hypothetical protein